MIARIATARARLVVVFAALAGLRSVASADDARQHAREPDVTFYLGTSHGGDAQLHRDLRPVDCNCREFPARLASERDEPTLATVGVAAAGTHGMVRGGFELFGVIGATNDASGYVGGVTFVGIQQWRVYGVGGVGLGRYVGGQHDEFFDAFAGSLRGEMGARLGHGLGVFVRVDVLQNDISTTRLGTLGISWAPPR